AELAYKKQQFQELIAQGEIESAGQTLAGLPPEAQRELQPLLADAKVAAERSRKDQEREAAEAAQNAKLQEHQAKAEAAAVAFAVVQRKFAGQEWARAAAECDRVVDANGGEEHLLKRAKLLQGLIPTYGRNYEDGTKKFRAGQMVASVRPLRK